MILKIREKKFHRKREKKTKNRKSQLKSHLKSIFGKSILNDFSIEIFDFFLDFFFENIFQIQFSPRQKMFSSRFFFRFHFLEILILKKKRLRTLEIGDFPKI